MTAFRSHWDDWAPTATQPVPSTAKTDRSPLLSVLAVPSASGGGACNAPAVAEATQPQPVLSLRSHLSQDDIERAAIVQFDAKAPAEWADGYARLLAMPAPATIPTTRWQQMIDDAGRFLDRWGATAAGLGWDTASVFGCHPDAPLARYDAAGLAWLIQGREVVAITSEAATLRAASGALLRYYRRSDQSGVMAWELGAAP